PRARTEKNPCRLQIQGRQLSPRVLARPNRTGCRRRQMPRKLRPAAGRAELKGNQDELRGIVPYGSDTRRLAPPPPPRIFRAPDGEARPGRPARGCQPLFSFTVCPPAAAHSGNPSARCTAV